MATTMVAMEMLRAMMPLVHESDLEMALGDLRGLCHKWNARREYRLELAASEVDILNGSFCSLCGAAACPINPEGCGQQIYGAGDGVNINLFYRACTNSQHDRSNPRDCVQVPGKH